jgi:hypothetical protein
MSLPRGIVKMGCVGDVRGGWSLELDRRVDRGGMKRGEAETSGMR